jgi:hypothetical protein
MYHRTVVHKDVGPIIPRRKDVPSGNEGFPASCVSPCCWTPNYLLVNMMLTLEYSIVTGEGPSNIHLLADTELRMLGIR